MSWRAELQAIGRKVPADQVPELVYELARLQSRLVDREPEADRRRRQVDVMVEVAAALGRGRGLSVRALRRAVKARDGDIDRALRWLEERGRVEWTQGPRGARIYRLAGPTTGPGGNGRPGRGPGPGHGGPLEGRDRRGPGGRL